MLDGGTVCRCSHLTDFASRVELLLQSNREVFAVGARPITSADIAANPEAFIAVGAMTLGIIAAAVGTLWVEERDRIRFSRRLVRDPEVAMVRDMVRLEGSSELLTSALRDWESVAGNPKAKKAIKIERKKHLGRALKVTVLALRDMVCSDVAPVPARLVPSQSRSSRKKTSGKMTKESKLKKPSLPRYEAHIPGARVFLEQELIALEADAREDASKGTVYACFH